MTIWGQVWPHVVPAGWPQWKPHQDKWDNSKGHHKGTFHTYTLQLKVNTLRPRQNGHHFLGDIFKCIFFNENEWITIKILLKFVPNGQINNIPSLVQIMAWRRTGDKPLSEAMMVSLLTHMIYASLCLNELTRSPHGQNGCHFTDDIFRCTFVNGKFCILIKISQSLLLRVQLAINQHWFR